MHEHIVKRSLLHFEGFILFCAGAILVAVIILLTSMIPAIRFLFDAHTFGPISEEVFKFTVLFGLVSIVNFNVLPIPFLGTGFGVFEAFRHLEVYGLVGGFAVTAHVVLGIVMAIFFYGAVTTKSRYLKWFFYIAALLVPVLLHFAYNNVVVTQFLL